MNSIEIKWIRSNSNRNKFLTEIKILKFELKNSLKLYERIKILNTFYKIFDKILIRIVSD